jgi:glycosyltransferase involved in cell wall biosynthesis
MKNLPSISIVVLCRNEQGFIAGCLDSLIANDYPKDRLEVLVADGMSEDATRSIVNRYSEEHPFVKLVDNPKRIPGAGANQGIRVAKGDFVMIVGAHARYPRDYVSKCVTYSQQYPAVDNVGGVRYTEPSDSTLVGRVIAYVSSHRFGAGTAPYHRGSSSPSYVDSVWGGCYRREIFERVGLYNEALRVGEDREFNQRLRGLGGKIMLVPEINCTYYARNNLLDYCGWAFRMGFWPFYAGKLVGRSLLSPRNFIPLAFVMSLALSFATAWFTRFGQASLAGILCAYILASMVSTLALVNRDRDPRQFLVAPVVFVVTHLLYGIGSLYAIAKPAAPLPSRHPLMRPQFPLTRPMRRNPELQVGTTQQ